MYTILLSFLWIWPGLIGLIVGLSELLNRYKSFERLFNGYSAIYMLINFTASVFVYFIFHLYKINLGAIGNNEIGYIVVAGIGAMGFMRSSFFNYKASNDKVIAIGPAAILDIFLDAAQRQFDQSLSGYNLSEMETTMGGLNFVSASKDLPIIILSSMRVLTAAEQKELSDEILKLVNDTNTTAEVKNIALGVILLKYTGMELLKKAVAVLRTIYNKKVLQDLQKIDQIQQQLNKIV
jgi:hypothetical protein